MGRVSHALYAVVHIHLCQNALQYNSSITTNYLLMRVLCLTEDEMCSVRFTGKQVFVVIVTGFCFCRLC